MFRKIPYMSIIKTIVLALMDGKLSADEAKKITAEIIDVIYSLRK